MRIARAVCCAAVALMLSVPVLRADEFNKMTYLTFSGSVQVPGVVLPAGTYMFKLADPEGGRRVIQIWDKEGTKLYTTLLTIPDQISEPKDDPVVLFTETPSGEPQAVKSWFYTGERNGYEFVYPKDQAMKIAQATHGSVLAQTGTGSGNDVASMSRTSVGRVDASGNVAGDTNNSTAAAQSAPARTNDTPQSQSASASASTPSQTATPPPASASQPSANRTDAGASRPATPATAAASKRDDSQKTVGTSGRLPQTASNAPLIQLMAGLSLIAAIGVHQLRKRHAGNQA
jgi:hypothetical protein